MNEGTYETVNGRPALRFERRLSHSVHRVWRAVSDPAELGQWFPAAVPWGPVVGEKIEAHGMTGEVTEVDRPHRLAWVFNGDDYSFEIYPDGDGCRLIFIHAFDASTPVAQTAAGWETYLMRLDALLAGAPLSEEEAHANWDEVHERYVGLFDDDPTPGRACWTRLKEQLKL